MLNNTSDLDCKQAEEITILADTPAFVFDEDYFIARAKELKKAGETAFEARGMRWGVVYAGKAFLSRHIAHLVAELGFGVDCCSQGEIMTACEGRVSGTMLGLHGNNKSRKEIETAAKLQFERLVVDSFSEVEFLDEVLTKLQESDELEVPLKVMVRVKTGIHAGGHEFISTAHEDQKFGLTADETVQAIKMLQPLIERGLVKITGIHTHIGSQILSPEAFVMSAQVMMDVRARILNEAELELSEIDLGGGFGVQYLDTDTPLDLQELFDEVAETVEKAAKTEGVSLPKVSFEPGRWLMAPSMVTLYRIGTIKDVEVACDGLECTKKREEAHKKGEEPSVKIRRYVSVDGGMADNIRPALYDAEYSCYLVAGHELSEETVSCRIVGKHCESGDILIQDVKLPKNLQRDDFLVVETTGAYCYSMASNYNGLPKPAVVRKTEGKFEVMIPRQRLESLVV